MRPAFQVAGVLLGAGLLAYHASSNPGPQPPHATSPSLPEKIVVPEAPVVPAAPVPSVVPVSPVSAPKAKCLCSPTCTCDPCLCKYPNECQPKPAPVTVKPATVKAAPAVQYVRRWVPSYGPLGRQRGGQWVVERANPQAQVQYRPQVQYRQQSQPRYFRSCSNGSCR
jgi:hypothetical protein